MIIINHVDTTLKHSACQPGLMVNTPCSVFFFFTTLDHSNTLVEIRPVVEKLLVLDYHYQKTIN